ncbi:MAG: calcineurin-like phosphoesterase C-terminal domain-containing protein [Bacteroidales bacterium]|nr:calcineurin-like phosphoesterase C-terminal domain-containing protein [Bacteroidales bacterium]
MKRIFILFLCGAALFACKKEDQNGGGGGGNEPQLPISVVGTVKGDDGTLLEGLVVSDGLVCVKTDASGHYELPADLTKAMYVWVSTPSGYAAPVEKGQAVFYKKIADCSKDSGGRSVADFTLKKISNPNKFTIFIYADPQPRKNSRGDTDQLAYKSLECCEDMYDDMQELKASITDQPVYGIGLGDIVHQDISLLDNHKTGMQRTGISNYNIIGNHDQCNNQTSANYEQSDDESWKLFAEKLGPVNYSFNLGNLHFLMLDNMISQGPGSGKWPDQECFTGFTEDIWKFIQNDLATVATDKTIMVCAHSPMMHYISDGSVKERGGRYIDQLRGLLKRYPKAYVWAGHSHSTFNKADTDPIETHTLTRVTGALWSNEYLGSNGTPRGYLVFKYDNGTVSWKFKPIFYQRGAHQKGVADDNDLYAYRDWNYVDAVVNGNNTRQAKKKSDGVMLDDSYQMQVFKPGTYSTDDEYLRVNVFMWDENWKTPRFNGTTMKRSASGNQNSRMYSYSEHKQTKYYYDKAPSFYSKVEDDNCFSMFHTHVEAHGSGEVTVEDPFGNTYSATITW